MAGTTAALTVACSPAATAVTWSASRDCTTPHRRQRRPGERHRDRRRPQLRVHRQRDRRRASPALRRSPSCGRALARPIAAERLRGHAHAGERLARHQRRCDLDVGQLQRRRRGHVVELAQEHDDRLVRRAQAPTDTLPANTGKCGRHATPTAVTACSGGACAPEVITTFTVSGSAPVGFCGQFSDVRFVDLNWGNPPVDTYGGVNLGRAR